MLRACALGSILLTCLLGPSACFATTLKDVQIGVRVVDFLVDPPSPKSSLVIIFDSGSKESQEDARNIMTWLSAESGGAKTSLLPVLLDVHKLDNALAVRVGFVAAGTEDSYAAILEYARKNGAVTISSDLSCVRSGKCTVGVTSAPRVEVIVNRQVSLASGVHFTEAFRMMVTEY
jgi:hypothetical protein